MRYVVILSLVVITSGCFATRRTSSLPGTDAIEEPVAILPVMPEHIVMPADSEEEYLEMAGETNTILNRLARGRNSKVLGPKNVRKTIDNSDVESLHRIIDESGDHAKSWKWQRLAEISKRLEAAKIIRVKAEILEPPAYTDNYDTGMTAGLGKHWRGWVDVSADLFGMSPPQQIEYRRVSKEFWGKTGVGCFLIPFLGPCFIPYPYAVGTTETRALDQAAREAIAGVLLESTKDKRDTDPVNE